MYIIVNMKGLELQEPTSCHNVESGEIDRIFDDVLGKDNGDIKSTYWNNNWRSSLTPITRLGKVFCISLYLTICNISYVF